MSVNVLEAPMITSLPSLPVLRTPAPEITLDEKRKRSWTVSFSIALLLHTLILAGAGQLKFYQKADFGLEGSTGSMEIYMVAALPEYTSKPAAAVRKQSEMPLLESENSMIVKEAVTEQTQTKSLEEERKTTREGERSEVKGDGSSPEPGESETTLYAPGSAEAVAKAGKFHNASPRYPAVAQRRGQQGVVLLRVNVDKNGRPSAVDVRRSSGYPLLDKEAVRAVRRWKFEAAHLGPVTIESKIDIPIRFSLSDGDVSVA